MDEQSRLPKHFDVAPLFALAFYITYAVWNNREQGKKVSTFSEFYITHSRHHDHRHHHNIVSLSDQEHNETFLCTLLT